VRIRDLISIVDDVNAGFRKKKKRGGEKRRRNRGGKSETRCISLKKKEEKGGEKGRGRGGRSEDPRRRVHSVRDSAWPSTRRERRRQEGARELP